MQNIIVEYGHARVSKAFVVRVGGVDVTETTSLQILVVWAVELAQL